MSLISFLLFLLLNINNIFAECLESDILHLNWASLTADGDDVIDNWPEFEYEIEFDQFNLEIIIDVNLTYLGYSVDKDGNHLGTTYILDFESGSAHILPLSQPGTCSNRVASDFEGNNFQDWWGYSVNTDSNPIVGDSQYLAYPPSGNDWFIESLSCDKVHYRGHFTYKQLYDECTDYNDTQTYSILTADDEWINLTLTFYINVVSPFTTKFNSGYYRIYQLLSAPFIVAIDKTIHVLQPIGIRLFTMSIIAVYKENDQNDFKLILVTETAEYLKLKQPELLTYPWNLENNHNIHFHINENEDEQDNHCLNNKAYICSQIWSISARDVPCPPSNFSGLYGLQFVTVCNNDSNTDSAINAQREESCQRWLLNYDGVTDLSTNLQWVDQVCDAKVWKVHFGANMRFYKNDNFDVSPVNDSHLFQVGESVVFVEIEVDIPSGAYQVFSASLINVWLCTTDPLIGEPTLDQTTGNGGCLASDTIDDDGPYFIFNRFDELSIYNFSMIDEDDPNKPAHVVRFSFLTPSSISRDTLYIHAQLSLSLIDTTNNTRRRLLDSSEGETDQIKHFLGEINTDPTNVKPYQYLKDIEQYKQKTGFYDEELPEKKMRHFIDEIKDNQYEYDEYDNHDGPYILITGDVFNVLKIVTVVVGILLFVNICLMIYWRFNKDRYNIQYYEYQQ